MGRTSDQRFGISQRHQQTELKYEIQAAPAHQASMVQHQANMVHEMKTEPGQQWKSVEEKNSNWPHMYQY